MPLHMEQEMWVIYDHPKDHPEHYVVRRWTTCPIEQSEEGAIPDAECQLADSLEEARSKVPPGLVCIRTPQDDPSIAETWL